MGIHGFSHRLLTSAAIGDQHEDGKCEKHLPHPSRECCYRVLLRTAAAFSDPKTEQKSEDAYQCTTERVRGSGRAPSIPRRAIGLSRSYQAATLCTSPRRCSPSGLSILFHEL